MPWTQDGTDAARLTHAESIGAASLRSSATQHRAAGEAVSHRPWAGRSGRSLHQCLARLR